MLPHNKNGSKGIYLLNPQIILFIFQYVQDKFYLTKDLTFLPKLYFKWGILIIHIEDLCNRMKFF